MTKKMLYERINDHVPIGTWYTLNEICGMINSPSLSLVKVTLLAMPNVQWRRVNHANSPIKGAKESKWIWQFMRTD